MHDTIKKQENVPGGKRRIHLMDELRGFAVLCMVFYHGFYTLAYLYKIGWGDVLFRFFLPAEPFFAALFIFISGVSSDLSHSNLRRGAKLFAFAAAVTLVTALAVPETAIWFGILHFLAVCMMGYGLLKPLLDRMRFSWFWPLLCGILYFFTDTIPKGYLGFGSVAVLKLPDVFYRTNWLAPLGFYNSAFTSADYFPLLPWAFVFLAGGFLGRFAAQEKLPAFAYDSHVPFLSWMGRHALIIYVVHQPVIFGLVWLIFFFISFFR